MSYNKGDQIGSKLLVLKRQDSLVEYNCVHNQIRAPDFNIESKQKIIVEVAVHDDGAWDSVAEYSTTVYEKGDSFSLKASVIKEHDLKPGQSIRVTAWEQKGFDFVDEAKVVDRVEVIEDNGASDGLDSRLNSKKVCEYLDGEEKSLKFRNARTSISACGSVSENARGHEFSFPFDVRRDINAEQGDVIEIIGNVDVSTNSKDKEEMFTEMYEMVREIHEAYLEAKDD